LFLGVVAGLTKCLDILDIPEHCFAATVRLDVVSYQEGSVSLHVSTPTLTGEAVPQEHLDAQVLPALELVPSAPRLIAARELHTLRRKGLRLVQATAGQVRQREVLTLEMKKPGAMARLYSEILAMDRFFHHLP
jgi:hypothetical protein